MAHVPLRVRPNWVICPTLPGRAERFHLCGNQLQAPHVPVTASARWRGARSTRRVPLICSIVELQPPTRRASLLDRGLTPHAIDATSRTTHGLAGALHQLRARARRAGPLVAKSGGKREPAAHPKAKVRGPVKGTPGGRKWRAWGSRHVGLRVRRTVFAEDHQHWARRTVRLFPGSTKRKATSGTLPAPRHLCGGWCMTKEGC